MPSYADRVSAEIEHYRAVENVHDLPKIYDYWSKGHVDPLLKAVGIHSFLDLWLEPITALASERDVVRVVSLGSGNGDFELTLGRELIRRGVSNFEVERLELNPHMRERAQQDAAAAQLSDRYVDRSADLNTWEPGQEGGYDVVLANHSLHHVIELEHLFAAVRVALGSSGVFIVNDMIGRNGHMRWPEALDLLNAVWAVAPQKYKFNHQFSRLDETFVNWDCSGDGFEGIRAQDILPLLNGTFFPEVFVGFANIIDPFVDRGYGHNFDPQRPEDRDFIDAVARIDEAALMLGIIKPTHLLARYKTVEGPCHFVAPLAPAFSERRPETEGAVSMGLDNVPSPSGSPGDGTANRAPVTRSTVMRLGVRVANLLPPIRRLRAQRDALAAELARLSAVTSRQ